jgi:hypothetical protein
MTEDNNFNNNSLKDFYKIECAKWLYNLLDADEIDLDFQVIRYYQYCTNDMKNIAISLLEKITKIDHITEKTDDENHLLNGGVKEYKEQVNELENILETDLSIESDILETMGSSVVDNLKLILKKNTTLGNMSDFHFFMTLHDEIGDLLTCEIIRGLKKFLTTVSNTIPEDYHRFINAIKDFFILDDNAIQVFSYIFLINTFPYISLEPFIYYPQKKATHRKLAFALNMSPVVFSERINMLKNLSIIFEDVDEDEGEYKFFYSQEINDIWNYPEDKNIEELFCIPYKSESLNIFELSVDKYEIFYLLSLLKNEKIKGVNILLYGSTGTGKSAFVRSLAHELGVNAWGLANKNTNNSGQDRRLSLNVCLSRAARNKGDIAVVENAENVLFNLNSPLSIVEQFDKGWINDLFANSVCPTIWVVNDPTMIDLSIKTHFNFCIHFPNLGINERRNVWRNILKRNGIEVP